jgi:hypothetical protein
MSDVTADSAATQTVLISDIAQGQSTNYVSINLTS